MQRGGFCTRGTSGLGVVGKIWLCSQAGVFLYEVQCVQIMADTMQLAWVQGGRFALIGAGAKCGPLLNNKKLHFGDGPLAVSLQPWLCLLSRARILP